MHLSLALLGIFIGASTAEWSMFTVPDLVVTMTTVVTPSSTAPTTTAEPASTPTSPCWQTFEDHNKCKDQCEVHPAVPVDGFCSPKTPNPNGGQSSDDQPYKCECYTGR